MLREDHYKDNQQPNQQPNQPSQSLADTDNEATVVTSDAAIVTATLNSSSSTEQSSVLPKSHIVLPNHHHLFFKSLSKLYYKNHCSWSHCYYRQPQLTSSIINRLRYTSGASYYQNNIKRYHHHYLHLQHNIHLFKKVIRRFSNKRPISNSATTCQNKPSIDSSPPPPPSPVNWTPPITYDTLKELSVNHIFKSLQLRHDLLFDPNLSFRPNLDGPSGRDKRKKAERYWRRVDRAFEQQHDWTFLQVIIQELCRILVSLMHPIASYPHIAAVVSGHTALPWHWPSYITKHHIHDVLDSDLIIQQLKYSKHIGNQVDWLRSTFESLLLQPQPLQQPQQQQHQQHQQNTMRLIDTMVRYFAEGKYAKALKQCFAILEAIKLNCANRVLSHYRNFLIETCAEFEYRCFVKHQYPLDSVDVWLSSAWKRFGASNSFQHVYYAGLVHLVTDETASEKWPVTFQFDQKRMTHQFRYEFQHLLVIAIMLVPYRQLTGSHLDACHIRTLKKQVYAKLIQLNATPLVLDESIYRQLAHHTCQTAALTNTGISSKTMTFWEAWMVHNVKQTSPIFQLMYERLSRQLQYVAQHGKLIPQESTVEVLGLEEEIRALGLKLKLVADLNLEAFSKVYNNRLVNKT